MLYMANQSTVATNLSTTVLTCDVSIQSTSEICDSDLEKFWDLESLGIVPNENSVRDTFEQRVDFDGMKYQVSLPWKSKANQNTAKPVIEEDESYAKGTTGPKENAKQSDKA